MRSVLLCILLVGGLSSPTLGQQPKEITNSIGMKLVLIHAGSFTLGSPEGEVGKLDSETQNELEHEVTISRSYYLAMYESTQGEYQKVMGNNPSSFKGANNPVEISWNDAVLFCKKLSELPEEKADGREYRLPTEAEWEYACRARSTTRYCFGDAEEILGEYAWFLENSERKTHPVGEKKPNSWGLYDMHGNVWEWCQDLYADYPSDALTDPKGPIEGSSRVFRGGSFISVADNCRSAFRIRLDPSRRIIFYSGFRVAMSLPAKQPAPAPTK